MVKDHAFFMGSYEAIRELVGLTGVSSVPMLESRAALGPIFGNPATPVAMDPNVKPFLDLIPFSDRNMISATFSDWIKADRTARKRGLAQCLLRIRDFEPSIHAWVVVEPGQAAGEGPLAEIPFGVKDIVETKGMAIEYGSPLYKGRVGNEDAAIIRS